jgi:hypothetical protein
MLKGRRTWLRGGITLGVVGIVAAALLMSPAGAHIDGWPHLKGHIKKIATRIAKKEAKTIVNTFGSTVFIEETELSRWGPITMSTGDADKTVGTFAGFTVKTRCELSAGNVRARVLVETSEDNAFFASPETTEEDFDIGDNATPVEWTDVTGNPPGGAADGYGGGGQGRGAAPSGKVFEGIAFTNTNFAGAHCWFAGDVVTVAPTT